MGDASIGVSMSYDTSNTHNLNITYVCNCLPLYAHVPEINDMHFNCVCVSQVWANI